MQSQYVQEGAAKLAARGANGSYPVVIITEGVGSSGIYPAELMSDESARLFENVPSFMDHPDWPSAPHERSVLKIGGRITNVRAGVSEGKAALLGDYTPREEYAKFVEEFRDIIALSIYSLATGSKNEEGVLVVEAFAPIDPYRSVDVVIAGGRGGKFARAEESLRTIESSLGAPAGNQPGVTSAQDQTQEERMLDPELKALIESLTSKVDTALTELNAARDAARQAEADAKASKEDSASVVEAYETRRTAIDEADLPEKLAAPLIESAKAGVDPTPELERIAAISSALSESAHTPADEAAGIVIESAGTGGKKSFALKMGGRS